MEILKRGKIVYQIEDYDFATFQGSDPFNKGEASSYKFQTLDPMEKVESPEIQGRIKVERTREAGEGFRISPIVREHRGLRNQEDKEREKKIAEEVEKRVESLKKQAFEQGFNQGVESGREDIYNRTERKVDEKLATLSDMINVVNRSQKAMFVRQKQEIYDLVKNLTKWVITRELRDDGRYIERLLEKLILEMDSRSNLTLHVNQKDFSSMPEVLEAVQDKIGQLSNVRIVVDQEIKGQGMKLDSENGIISGTIEEQFRSLDRLFASVELWEE